MKTIFINEDSIEKFEEGFEEIQKDGKSILILSCDGNNYDSKRFDTALKSTQKPIIGGIFPQIIYQNMNYSKGTILVSLENQFELLTIENLSSTQDLDHLVEDISIDKLKTMFVFVDGLSKNINKLIATLFDNFGLDINYVGGGCGSLSFVQKPVVITNQGLKEDCALLAFSSLESSIGVKHGWEKISEELQVTKSIDNEVVEINYKDAFEVYKEVVEKVSNQKFNESNFFDIAKGYPLGIGKISGDLVVRDPITTDGKSLICVGSVPNNSFIYILKGESKKLIEAASLASVEAKMEQEHFTLFIDCISRVLFLEEDFPKEIEAIRKDEKILIGALTLGEIANNQSHYLEFYNKTSVVANIEI